MSVATDLQQLYRPIDAEIAEVRRLMSDLWDEVLGIVDPGAQSDTAVGGKLLRPAMCLLSSGAIGAPRPADFVPMSAAMEMFHLAALAHDDVIDGANLRRGSISLNAMWSDHAAVLGGDYLVARGITVLASYGSCELLTHAIDCIRIMAEGELAHFGRGPDHHSEEACLGLVRAKTASLFAVSCSTPCFVAADSYRDALYAYGEAVGMAFQLVDDLLDLRQDETVLGKPSCGDIVEGKKTIPILYMRNALDEAGTRRLDALRGRALDPDERAWVADMLEETGAATSTEQMARTYIDKARQSLADLPPGPFLDSLHGLAEFVLVRGS